MLSLIEYNKNVSGRVFPEKVMLTSNLIKTEHLSKPETVEIRAQNIFMERKKARTCMNEESLEELNALLELENNIQF